RADGRRRSGRLPRLACGVDGHRDDAARRRRMDGAMSEQSTGGEFPTVFGRNLIGELRNFVHRPYLVVTMEDLWPRFEHHFDANLAAVHLVTSLDLDELSAQVDHLPAAGSIVGIGGGQAMDVAKFFAWSRRLPLFLVSTAM